MKRIVVLLIVNILLISCSKGYTKIKEKWVYKSFDEAAGVRIKDINADNATFQILKNDNYAKDKSYVYYNGVIIENANPKYFSVLDNGYSKDGNNVFFQNETLIDSNPQSFQILEFPYSKDHQKIYCGTIPLLTSDIENFIVQKPGSITTTEMTINFIRDNPEYAKIDTVKYKAVVYGDGIAKTKTETFYGYKKQ